MGKFSGMLFTGDFDHTISDHEGNIPQNNLDAIKYFIAEGGRFCLNTGRSIAAARSRALQVPCNAPCLLYNGGACYDYRTGELIFAHPLSEQACKLPPVLEAEDIGIEIQGIEHHYSKALIPSREPMLRKAGMETVITEEIPLPWMKIVLCGKGGSVLERHDQVPPEEQRRFAELQKQVEALCGEEFYVTASMPRIIEIGNPHCTKATGARQLAKMLDCHTVICAGDAPNDIPMLLDADLAFCPSDAHPQILALPGIHITVPAPEGCIAASVAFLDHHVK
ncbi:MAG: HAD-IIB family hydrolase [Oscillospiraceae bacterium]|nr:HAD-IIB family hydrolase [Oscillospiraceae bacterium]